MVTIEEAVGNGAARSKGLPLASERVLRTPIWVTVRTELAVMAAFSNQLDVISRLDIATMVLVKVAQSIVHVHWALCW